MTTQNIMDWISGHDGQSRKENYFDVGNKTQHVVRFENGDTYQHIEIYEGIMRKHTETIINNKTVRKEELCYHCFGWKSTTTTR